MTEQPNSTCFCVLLSVWQYLALRKKSKGLKLLYSYSLSTTSLTPQSHIFPHYYLFLNNCHTVLIMWKHVKVYSHVTENNIKKNLFKICLVLSILTSISLFASRTHTHTEATQVSHVLYHSMRGKYPLVREVPFGFILHLILGWLHAWETGL